MSEHIVAITITPKDGVLDIQGKAVEKTLLAGGYSGVGEVRVGRFVRLKLEAENAEAAKAEAAKMCDDLLANDLIETWSMEVVS